MSHTIYRVENPRTMQGLWYRGDGTFNPHILTLSDGKCRDLPMGFDPTFKTSGLDWFSACDNLDDMQNWFSLADLKELSQQGYGLYRFEVSRLIRVPGHVAFTREHVMCSKLVPTSLICAEWGQA